jgi:hypothetical protein
MTPDCPVCKTNKYMIRAYDNATYASGIDDGKYCSSYSDSFECSCCGGRIHYYEERVADKLCAVEINYKQKNYNMRRKVVG